jgi:hypothetical protein
MPEIRYHYQGRILEADQYEQAGHALRIPDPQHPGRFHYVWPEQVIWNGVPAQDPYGLRHSGPTLHPEQFRAGAQNGAATPARARTAGSGGGEITLQEICREAGIEPSLARRILRKNMPRPEGRWSFTPAEKDTVINLLRSKK